MSVKIENPKVFEKEGISTLQFFWCNRNEMFALNSLEVLDYNQFIYRCLKSSGFKVVVFLDLAPNDSGRQPQYRYITYDRVSYCVFNYPDKYDHEKNKNDFGNIISLATEEIENSNKKKAGSLVTGQISASKKTLPPERGIQSEGNVELKNLASKISPFFTQREFANLKFAFVLSATIFLRKYNSDLDPALANLLDLFSTSPVNKYGKTILITVDNENEYKAYCDVVKCDTITPDVKDIFEYAKSKEIGSLIRVDGAKDDEIRNLLLRFRLLESEKFAYSPLDVELLVNRVREYAEKRVASIGDVSLIGFLNLKFEHDTEALSSEIHKALSSLRESVSATEYSKNIINREKAALSILRLPLEEVHGIDSTPPDELYKKAKAALWELIGLEKVKKNIEIALNVVKYGKGPLEPGHYVFRGKPGTGKTVVARIMGEMFKAMGILKKEIPVEVDREKLVAGYVGQTAIKTKEKLEEAIDGVLLVDEAYMLTKGHQGSNDFGQEAVDTIMKYMEDNRERLCVIFTGYTKDMEEFLDSNDGIKSRILKTNYIDFPDYSDKDLVDILHLMMKSRGYSFNGDYIEKAKEVFRYQRVLDPEKFGNARLVRELLNGSIGLCATRFAADIEKGISDPGKQFTLIADDIPPEYLPDIDSTPKEELYEKAKTALWKLIGLEKVKETVEIALNEVKYGKGPKEPGHYIFSGKPGTGKTAVARIMGEMFKAVGILQKGHLVEVDRADLVAGYVGQTAIKTKAKLDEALDGVLLVDEAYMLTKGHQGSNDFGQEAVDTIMKYMEDNRERLCVIFTGYTQDMKEFLDSNDGIASRIADDNFIEFPDYSDDELIQILRLMVKDKEYTADSTYIEKAKEVFRYKRTSEPQKFGNARLVRNLVRGSIKRCSHRTATDIKNGTFDEDKQYELIVEDIPPEYLPDSGNTLLNSRRNNDE